MQAFLTLQDFKIGKKIKCYYYWSHESVCIPHEQIIATNQD